MPARRRKRRTHIIDGDTDPNLTSEEKLPQSFVVGKGKLTGEQGQLVKDFRKAMEPLTASKLQERRNNAIKDFLNVAGPLGVTHMISFSGTELGTYMRLGRVPHGPTLTYRVKEFSLCRDIISKQKRPAAPRKMDYMQSPLVVLSNFNAAAGETDAQSKHTKLAGIMFQNLFPSINVHEIKLATMKRVLLASYDKDSQKIELRHFSISSRAAGVNRKIQKIAGDAASVGEMPDLSNLNDISEVVGDVDGGSDSETENEADQTVQLQDGATWGAKRMKLRQNERKRTGGDESGPNKRSLRLREIGPRLTLELLKIEKDFYKGDVLYHRHVAKTPEEIAEYKASVTHKEAAKAARRAEQAANVKKKAATKKKRRNEYSHPDKLNKDRGEDNDSGDESHGDGDAELLTASTSLYEDDDDAQYYRDEVGEDAEAGTFSSSRSTGKIVHDPADPSRQSNQVLSGSKTKRAVARKISGGATNGGKNKGRVGSVRHPFAGPLSGKVKKSLRKQEKREKEKQKGKGKGKGKGGGGQDGGAGRSGDDGAQGSMGAMGGRDRSRATSAHGKRRKN
jgi:ribosome biogenesis protein SSF1/2